MTTPGSIASRWRELQGANSWAGLLDPLDLDLRTNLITYGELTEATYDGFNQETRSPHAGACLFGYSDLLASSYAAAAGNYTVTKFIYATSTLPGVPEAFLLLPLPDLLPESWSRESNWMGYVAVANDAGVVALGRRDILVAWRGTLRSLEWVNDFDFTPVSAAPVLGSAAAAHPLALVHQGFLSVYTTSNPNSKFNQTSAKDQTAFASFPDLRALHVKNAGDVVPMVPPLPYVDVAVDLPINTSRSPYLKQPGTIRTLHSLECYMHGVAGEQGSAGGFNLEVDRDVALVNEEEDALKDQYPVPVAWYVAKNKFMVKGADGHWALQDFEQI